METKSTVIGAGIAAADARRLEFKYDYQHRRVEKTVFCGWNGSAYATTLSVTRFLYDGWNLIGEYSVSSGTLSLVRSYTWGLDITGDMTKAGGVGGLLQIADHASGKTFLPAYDGSGNVVALLNASTGAVAAAYEYSPFGEFLRRESPDSAVADQPFRYSTKFYDGETGLYYFGRRHYSPSQGRFLGRDPAKEKGGLNLYGFCGNNSVNRWDYLGMFSAVDPDWRIEEIQARIDEINETLNTYQDELVGTHEYDELKRELAALEHAIAQISAESQRVGNGNSSTRGMDENGNPTTGDAGTGSLTINIGITTPPIVWGAPPPPPPVLTLAFRGLFGHGDDAAFQKLATDVGAAPPLNSGAMAAARKQIDDFLKLNPNGTINLMGYSRGGATAIALANALAKDGIQINALITFDPHGITPRNPETITLDGSNVKTVLNYYQRNGPATGGGFGGGDNPYLGARIVRRNGGAVTNRNLTGITNQFGQKITHLTIVEDVATYTAFRNEIFNALGVPIPTH